MVNDIIADSITRIRNASIRKLEHTTLYYSKVVMSILEIFKEKKFIKDFRIDENGNKKNIVVILYYDDKHNSNINEIKRISKPGRRIYKHSSELRRFKNGYGAMIVSTSKGVLSNEDAYNNNVGGEVLCSIW